MQQPSASVSGARVTVKALIDRISAIADHVGLTVEGGKRRWQMQGPTEPLPRAQQVVTIMGQDPTNPLRQHVDLALLAAALTANGYQVQQHRAPVGEYDKALCHGLNVRWPAEPDGTWVGLIQHVAAQAIGVDYARHFTVEAGLDPNTVYVEADADASERQASVNASILVNFAGVLRLRGFRVTQMAYTPTLQGRQASYLRQLEVRKPAPRAKPTRGEYPPDDCRVVSQPGDSLHLQFLTDRLGARALCGRYSEADIWPTRNDSPRQFLAEAVCLACRTTLQEYKANIAKQQAVGTPQDTAANDEAWDNAADVAVTISDGLETFGEAWPGEHKVVEDSSLAMFDMRTPTGRLYRITVEELPRGQ